MATRLFLCSPMRNGGAEGLWIPPLGETGAEQRTPHTEEVSSCNASRLPSF